MTPRVDIAQLSARRFAIDYAVLGGLTTFVGFYGVSFVRSGYLPAIVLAATLTGAGAGALAPHALGLAQRLPLALLVLAALGFGAWWGQTAALVATWTSPLFEPPARGLGCGVGDMEGLLITLWMAAGQLAVFVIPHAVLRAKDRPVWPLFLLFSCTATGLRWLIPDPFELGAGIARATLVLHLASLLPGLTLLYACHSDASRRSREREVPR